jgi:hypothetical protein
MSIEKIINKPITTSCYPDPTEARRYLDDPDGFYGYDYVFLEDDAWNARKRQPITTLTVAGSVRCVPSGHSLIG